MAKRNEDQSAISSKIRDRAFLLPLIGTLLFIPPIADIFQLDSRMANIPFTAIYLFTVWGLLILGAALLSRRLHQEHDDSKSDGIAEDQN